MTIDFPVSSLQTRTGMIGRTTSPPREVAASHMMGLVDGAGPCTEGPCGGGADADAGAYDGGGGAFCMSGWNGMLDDDVDCGWL